MRASNLVIAGLGVVLAGGLVAPALAQGWGMMNNDGYGYGMNGYGPGYGMMGGYGYGGRGYGMMNGYGPGYGMMNGYGPGWMNRGWMGQGSRGGWMMDGPGYNGPSRDLKLSVDDVKKYVEQLIENPRLKLGEVKEKDADTITAEVVTKDKDALVQKFAFNRHNGRYQPEQ